MEPSVILKCTALLPLDLKLLAILKTLLDGGRHLNDVDLAFGAGPRVHRDEADSSLEPVPGRSGKNSQRDDGVQPKRPGTQSGGKKSADHHEGGDAKP